MAMTGGKAYRVGHNKANYGKASWYIDLYIYVKEESQNVAKNETTLSLGMYVTTPGEGYGIGQWDDWNAVSYIGTSSNIFDGTMPYYSGGTKWIVENKKLTVKHNDDGTKKASIPWYWNVNSPWGQYVYPSGTVEHTITAIKRATTPTLSATSVQMGKAVTITMNRAASTFTHTLKYTINGTTKTIASGLGTSYTWTVPDLTSLLSNATLGTANIICETYNGTNLVGTSNVNLEITVYAATTPVLSEDVLQMGEHVTITLNRASSSYTHNLSYEIGTKSGTIATSVGTSREWFIPKELVTEVINAVSGKLTIICTTKNGTATVGTQKITATVKVPTASVVKPASTTAVMGETLKINTGTKAEQYTHTVTYTFGGKNYLIGEEKAVGASVDWNIPITLAKSFPDDTICAVTINCTTYNGSAKVGDTSYPVGLLVPDNDVTKPRFTMDLIPEHSLDDEFKDVFVQGKSKVNVTFWADSEYSNIKSYAINVEGITVEENTSVVVSDVIMTSGVVAVTGTVTDTRGYSKTITANLAVLAYARPKLIPYGTESDIVCTRSDSNGSVDKDGVYVLLKTRALYSELREHNKCYLRYRYKKASASDYSTDWADLNGTVINSILSDVVEFPVQTSYTIQVAVKDDVGEEQIYTFPINAKRTPLHLGRGGNKVGLGQFCDSSNPDESRMDIGWTTYFNTGIGKKVIFESPDTTSGWGQGVILNDQFDDADTTVIMNYTLFLAIAKNADGLIPVLCVRVNDTVYGNSGGLQMQYSTGDNTLMLSKATDIEFITALYALL